MASSALTTTLLLSGTSFAMKGLSCVRQKSLSADPHNTYCSSTFSVGVRLCVHAEDTWADLRGAPSA